MKTLETILLDYLLFYKNHVVAWFSSLHGSFLNEIAVAVTILWEITDYIPIFRFMSEKWQMWL